MPLLARVLDPYLVVLNAMPKVALGPIIIVIFGPNISSSIAMGVIISIIITILVIYSAFQEVDSNYIKVMDTFGANKWQCYKQVVLPASFPAIISTLKVNVGLSWVGVIFGELLVSKQGLGYLISYGFQVFNFTLVLLSVLLTCVLATLMYVFVEAFEKFNWKKKEADSKQCAIVSFFLLPFITHFRFICNVSIRNRNCMETVFHTYCNDIIFRSIT